jgi:hypothetical protein
MMLLQKPSEIEIDNNKDIYESFCMAIIGRDLNLIKELLCDKGRFLNRSKLEFLGYMNSLISTLPKVGIYDFDILKGICLDQVPGSLSCEIVAKNWYPLREKMNIQMENKKSIDFRFCFSLVIEEDLITHVFTPKNRIKLEDLQKFVERN